MGSMKKDMVLAGKAAAGAAAAGLVKGLVLNDRDLGEITFDNEDDLDLFTDHGTGTGLFLDKFSKDDIWRMMEELQIQDHIRARSSHTDLSLSFDLRDPFVHKMYLRSSVVEEPLCELFLRIFHNLSNFHVADDSPQTAQGAALVKSSLMPSASEGELRLLFAEWMLLQDPAAPIVDGKMLLPGQRYPGLGVANQFGELLLRMGKELSCDAFINRPLFFHNALLYAGTHAFLNPEVEGRFLAMVRDVMADVKEKGISAVSQGIRCGVLKHIASNRVVTWVADEQARPISNRMRAFMESEKYMSLAKQHCPEMESFHRNIATIFNTFSRSRDPLTTSHDNLSPLHATRASLPLSPRSNTPGNPILEEESNPKRRHQPSSSGKAPNDEGASSNGGRENDGRIAARMTESRREKERATTRSESGSETGSSNLGGWVHELVGRKSPLRGRPSEDVEQGVGKGDDSLARNGRAVETFRGRPLRKGSFVNRERRVFAMDWGADLEDLAVVDARIKGGITFREVDTS